MSTPGDDVPMPASQGSRFTKHIWQRGATVKPIDHKVGAIVDVIEYKKRDNTNRRWWVIDPRHSKIMQRWDPMIITALIFTATVTPVEVAFIPPPLSYVNPLFLVNRLIDVIFIIDVGFQFVLMYTEESREGARWVHDPRMIWRHYMGGWFSIDLVSIIVSGFDFISIASAAQGAGGEPGSGNASLAGGGAEPEVLTTVSKIKALRLLRVLRLIKLLRLLRMSRIFKRWEAKMAFNYAALALVRVFSNVLLWAHLAACIWALQADLFFEFRHETWMGADGLCHPADTSVVGAIEEECEAPGVLYVAALYWSVMTITSIGYGDIQPVRWPERVVATFLMLLGAVLWGQLIGTFCSVVATFNPEASEFRRLMDELNRFMQMNGLEREMQQRLREYDNYAAEPMPDPSSLSCVPRDPIFPQRYFHQTKHLRVTLSHRHLLRQLSPQLAGEVAWATNEKWLRRVWFLREAEESFIIQASLQLTPIVFVPSELAATGFLYIVHRGIALYGGKVLTFGKVWGADMILTSATLQRQWCARAMTYLEVYTLSRTQLLSISQHFPHTAGLIRRAALLLALRRYIVMAAMELKLARAAESGTAVKERRMTASDRLFLAASSSGMNDGMASLSSGLNQKVSNTDALVGLDRDAGNGGRDGNQTFQKRGRGSLLDGRGGPPRPAMGHGGSLLGPSGGDGTLLWNEVTSLKGDMLEIKSMLTQVLARAGPGSGLL